MDAEAGSQALLRAPTTEEIRLVCSTFSRFTAIGTDNLHPRHIGNLSDDALQVLIVIMMTAINVGKLPSAIETILVVLLPKDSGGTRPIGIFTTIVRVFMRWARRAFTDVWEQSVPRPFWFGIKGATVQRGVWRLSLAGEYAKSTGQAAASALIDLEKAFENISFEWLWVSAQKYGYPLRLLRFLIALYSGPRDVMVDKIATVLVHALLNGVVAGCSHATAMMKLALITSLDHTKQAWKSVFMAVVVDDTQFQAVGPKNMVVRLVGGAARCFCEHAKEHAKLVLNMSKLEVVVDDPQTANEVLKGLGVKARRKLCTRNLGVDYACGGKRLKKSLVRMPFLKRL